MCLLAQLISDKGNIQSKVSTKSANKLKFSFAKLQTKRQHIGYLLFVSVLGL